MSLFLKMLLFTLIETIGVGLVWDKFFDSGHILIASLLALPFFVYEHILAKNATQNLPLFGISKSHIFKQVVLGVTEVAFWDVWRLIHERVEFPLVGPFLAVVVFAALLVLQHNAEANTNNNDPFFSRLFRSQGVLISIVESYTAFAWLLFDDVTNRIVALLPLFLGLALEHYIRVFGEKHGENV